MIDPKLIDKAIKMSKKTKGYDIIQMFFQELFKRSVCEVIKTFTLKKNLKNFLRWTKNMLQSSFTKTQKI